MSPAPDSGATDLRSTYKTEHTSVPGWFHAVDLAVFEHTDASQRTAGVLGSVLEIGVYQGASAILLGFLVDDAQELVVCDLFDSTTVPNPDLAAADPGASNQAENAAYYGGLAQQTFESHYLRYHDALPQIRCCSSAELDPSALDPMRLMHIDGSHLYDFVRADLTLSR